MKRAVITIVTASILLAPYCVSARGTGNMGPGSVPRVAYGRPPDGSVIDIGDDKDVVFEWCQVPMPSGGRDSFRFVMRKADAYGNIVDEKLSERVFSIAVPASKLERGQRYCWYVKQRDDRTNVWSEYDIWYFTVAGNGGQAGTGR
jgi:hypothetical protein